ncbi:Glycosyltransferase, GT2 family [Rhodococcus pyridinivorans]|uniref:glycosyltransferase family 2 protein n=1 Tax=Rhodococcus pyridinivorans TaxID=103816 RepID=UPI0007CD8B14|nr:glycosyltransferase [Rhodococcus pyridinivorans]SEC32987.1 Glycosyltransferase, GT2 family [Rhodococcus pyridinivorans]
MTVSVVTVAAGRGTHLRRQLDGLARSTRTPDEHIVVAMGDPEVTEVVATAGSSARVVEMDVDSAKLPVGEARNLGARTASSDLLVFLDVDCIPAPDLIERYAEAAGRHPAALLNGPVTYLSEPGADGYDLDRLGDAIDPHSARPFPSSGEIVLDDRHELFWSLSFASRSLVWDRIGGFCTAYSGYGGEDTDFGQKAARAGVPMAWVGGAHAFHQYHPVSSPPVEHLDDILTNAALFHQRWGWWPMRGWLDEFERTGLVSFDPDAQRWTKVRTTGP